MKMHNALPMCLALVALAACSSGSGSDNKAPEDATTEDKDGDYTQDAGAIADYQSDLLDEVTSALDENGSGGAAAATFAAAPLAPARGRVTQRAGNENYSRVCTENEPETGKVTVLITFSRGVTGTITRVWDPDADEDAVCTTGGHFKFKGLGKSGDDIDKLGLVETVDLVKPRVTVKGTRSTTFADTTDTDFTYEKTIDIETTRTRTVKKKDDSETTRTVAVSTPTNIVVKVKRDAATGELQKKLITTGTTVRTISASKTEITNTFDNLLFDLTGDDDEACIPVSGSLSGETKKDGTVVKSFTITFGANTATFASGMSIKVGDAEAVDCPTCAEKECAFKE